MAEKQLESSAVSAFCTSVATMLAAGVQTDEAVHMLSENREQSPFKRVCDTVYAKLAEGLDLAESMEATGAFPAYAVEMVRVGERSGRTERVLRSLGRYYESERRSFAKLQSSVGYPAALLCIMSIILLFTVIVILPIFTSTYDDMSGSLTSGSFSMVGASMIIGYVALAIVLVATVCAVIISILTHSESGRARYFAHAQVPRHQPGNVPAGAFPLHQRPCRVRGFRRAGRAGTAPGNGHCRPPRACRQARQHPGQHDRLGQPRSLGQAIVENEVFEPAYGRMLLMGTRSGSSDEVLTHLSDIFFEDANAQIDSAVDSVEPALAAFLTVAVGATLIAVMLPLIGIMGSIA